MNQLLRVNRFCEPAIHSCWPYGYCRFRCKTFTSRQATKHASRVIGSDRRGFGKCGSYDVFAEVNKSDGGVTEYFDPKTHALVGAVDTLAPGCSTYGQVPACTPSVTWEKSPPVPTLKSGPIQVFDDDDEPSPPPNAPNAQQRK